MSLTTSTTGIPGGVRRRGAAILAGCLVAFSVAAVVVGIADVWIRGRDGDMDKRLTEYEVYRDGIYPNPRIDPFPAERRKVYSVYPPWSFPMFSAFFEPGGKLQGRIVVQTLSIVALATMARYSWNRSRHLGVVEATIAATTGAAIAGNASALALGQFSIICMGLVAAQLNLLQRGRPLAAGACWALAMIKPHLGVAFTPLFLTAGNFGGLVAGCGILAGLSLLACAQTDVSPAALVHHWLVRSDLGFNGHAALQHSIGSTTGLSQRFLVGAGIAAIGGMAAAVLARSRRLVATDLLRLAAPLAAVCMVAVYHRHYDNVMLWPTMLACLERAYATRSRTDTAIAAGMGASLVLHERLLAHVPYFHLGLTAMWALAAWRLIRSSSILEPSRGSP